VNRQSSATEEKSIRARARYSREATKRAAFFSAKTSCLILAENEQEARLSLSKQRKQHMHRQ